MSDDDSDGATEAAQQLALPRELELESSANDIAASSLLAPGLPRHVDSPGGIRAVHRAELAAALDEHVRSLGPPHALVLTGVEGCGKSTALAQLCERVDAMERRWEERRRGGVVDPSEAPPFILKHSFADPSFSRDVSHFLERACLVLKRRFNIREPIPNDPAQLPEAFATFLEHAAVFRRVLVIVDAAESIAIPPYATYPASAVAGLDPRDGHALPELTLTRGDSLDAVADSDAPPFDIADTRDHFRWIPNSPPLAVRFIVSGRDGVEEKGAPGGIVRGMLRALGAASVRISPTPPLTTEETSAMLAMFSPRHPGVRPKDSHHRGKEISEVVNQVEPHGPTPLWVRTAAARICAAVETTKHGAWVSTSGAGGSAVVDEWGNVGEKDEWGNPIEAPIRDASVPGEDIDETLECPRTVSSKVRDMPGTARGLFWEALDAMELRHGEHVVSSMCVAIAVARFGVTRDELHGAMRCRFERERSRNRFGPGGSGTQAESLRKLDDGRFAAALDSLDPWLAVWCAKDAWHAELETFEGDRLGASAEESGARLARHEREKNRRRMLSGPGGPSYKPPEGINPHAVELPVRFRDDAFRAAAMERYAPPKSARFREEFHADLAAYFLDVAAGSGSRALRSDTRRALRAGLWHAAAGRDTRSVGEVLGRKGVMACLSRPGARSDVRAVCGEISAETWAAWRDGLATWMTAEGDEGQATSTHGDLAGAGLVILGLLRWIGEPTLAASHVGEVRSWFGPPRGRSPHSIVLAAEHSRLMLANGEVSRADSLAGQSRAAADLFRAARDASRDPDADPDWEFDPAAIPALWAAALEPCGGFATAIASSDSLYAETVSVVAEIAVAKADAVCAATVGESANRAADEALRRVQSETDAWLRALNERAPSAIARAVTDAMDGSYDEYADGSIESGTREDAGDELTGLVKSLRRTREACVRFSRHVDAGIVAGRLISVLTAALGGDHPQCGAAKLEAAESAAAAAESSAAVPGYDEASAWARPAYDFAAAFYGSQSLPAARAAWCVAEALRRADGAAAARPMYAQALGATAAVLGKTHNGTGAMLSETAELSRLERRLEEADALAREGLDIAQLELADARRGLDEADASCSRAIQRRAVTIGEHGVDYLPHELLVAIDHVRETATARASQAEADFAERATQVARVIHAMGRLPDAESFLRRALFAGEKAFGPSDPSLAATLAALGRCALARRRPEEAEACFRHALGVDERAAMLAAERAAGLGGGGRGATSAATGFRHPRSAAHFVHIAAHHRSGGRHSRAEVYFHAALDSLETCDGSLPLPLADGFEESVADDGSVPNPDPGAVLNVLGMMYKDQGRMAQAAVRYERSIALGAAAMRAATRAGDRRAWRVAASAVSLRLCNLGALRARQNRAGDAAACFLRAATFAKNNLGDAHPQTALCRAWLVSAGGEDAAAVGVGKAAGVMLDAIVAGDFPQLAKPFATAWGALAGEDVAVKRALADKIVKDIEASKPFPMETSSGPASRPATAAASRPSTAARPRSARPPTADRPTALAVALPDPPPPPEVYAALDRYRQVDEAKRAWSAWAHVTPGGDNIADLLDGLECDECLAAVVDDVAAVARTSLIEPKNIVPTSVMFVDGATKAFRAAAAARIKAGFVGRTGAHDGWAAHGDGGDGRILSEVLAAAARGEPITLPPAPPEVSPMSVDRDGAKEGAAEHARRLAVERAEMEAATSIPGHVRAKAEIENLEISEERRRAKTEPTANYALRELDRDDDDHVFEDYYRQKLGVRLMESEERAAWQKKADEIESRRAREIFDAQTDPAKLRQILAREREAYLPELIADKIRNGLEDPGGRGHDFWVPGEFEKAAREQDDARAMMKAAREERDSIKRELLELEAESLSRATSRAQSRHQSRLATPVKKKHGTERERERREGRRERIGSRDGREGETDEERERRRRRKEAKRSKANSRAHSRRQSTRTTPHKPRQPHEDSSADPYRSSRHATPGKKKSARASLKFGQRFDEENRRADAAEEATATARDIAAQAAQRFDRAHAAMVAASDAALEARIRAATASPMKPQMKSYVRPASASRSTRDKLAAFQSRKVRPQSANNPVEAQRREDRARHAKLYGDGDDTVEVGSAFGADTYQDIDDVAYDRENRYVPNGNSRGGSVRASMESLHKPASTDFINPAGMMNIPVAVPLYPGGGSVRASVDSLPPRRPPARRGEKEFEFPRLLEEERASVGGSRVRPASRRIARNIEDVDASQALQADLNHARRRNAFAAGAGAPMLERPFVSRSVNVERPALALAGASVRGRPSTSGGGASRGGDDVDDEWYWKMKKRVEQRRKELFSAPAQK